MAKYKVHALIITQAESLVEADSEAEARQIASQMSGVDYDEEGMTNGSETYVGDVYEFEECGGVHD